jgi:hypothetical protein
MIDQYFAYFAAKVKVKIGSGRMKPDEYQPWAFRFLAIFVY